MRAQKSILLGIVGLAFMSDINAMEVGTRLAAFNSNDVSAVEVILTQPNISTRAPVREEDLPNFGCTFTTTGDSKKTEALIDIINSEISIKNRKNKSFTLRNAIYFHMLDGTKIKILLSDSLNAANRVYGTASKSSKEPAQIESGEALLLQLRSWSSSDVSRKAHSSRLCDFK